MFLGSDFVNYLETLIGKLTGMTLFLENIIPISGGDINDAYRIIGKSNSFFLKVNSSHLYPKLFMMEREGLISLKRAGASVPECLGAGNFHDYAFIVLQWIESAENSPKAQENLGRMLALLHKNSDTTFGLDYDNYLGTVKQSNHRHQKWVDFFIEERLKKQLDLAKGKTVTDQSILKQFDQLFTKLPDLIPEEAPALLHGDLWNGNYLVGRHDTPYLIDPAIYYGHREMDIALSTLFGGFDPIFYQAYQEIFPLEKGWKERLSLHNLYILLFHANLFGGGYIQQVKSILNRFT